MMKQTMRKWVGVTLCLSLFFSMFSSVSGTAKKAAKIKKIEVRTTDSGVLVMKKKERKTLKLAINGKVSKTAWKRLKFRSKNKKAVKVNKKGKLTAKKKGSSKITITAKGSKKKTVLKVIVGTKVKSISMNATAYTLVEGGTVQLSAAVAPQKASYKKIRWSSSDTGVAVVTNGQVRAVKAGTATITAMSMDGTKKKAVCRIVVEKAGGSSSFPSVTPTVTVTGQPTESATATSTTTASGQPTATSTASGQPTATSTTTASGQPTESATATSTASGQPTATSTATASGQPTATSTATASGRPTATATTTASGQPTATATATPTATPTATASGQPTATPTATSTSKPETLLVKKCTDMAASGLTGTMEEPFKGVKLYTDGDAITTTYDFKGTNKKYRMILKGASTNNTAAGISLYIGGKKKGAVWFTGDKLSEQTIDFKMQEEETGSLEIMLKLETDNGSNDTCLESFELIFLADIPAPPEAPVPVGGAVKTGQYRNMFKELGYSEKEINAKVEEAWDKFFYGTEDERIYYPVGNDMAYIYTADTNDVRSEGMSYGMMICVQMDKQEEFNRLWKWAKTYMHHKDGERKGYFAWQCGTDGSKKDQNPAPDGEEYFVTSLFFASARWGDGDGIYDYKAQAQEILDDIMSRNDSGGGVVNMFNSSHKMVVFVPYGNSALYTDPSYHLPAFYEVWAELADKNNEFWSEAAQVSRDYFKKATNATTGLGPDYSEFSGEPKKEGNHGDFRFDAWRIAGNIACDYAWWGKDNWATTHADRIQAFFAKQGVESYKNQYAVDGKELEGDHSPGLVAMNATASLAASDKKAWAFLEDFWNISPTTGKYRYYDGCLYMMGLLHCSGRFRAWLPDGTTPSVSSTIAADSTEFDKETAKQKPIHVTMTLNGNTLTKIQNEGNALVQDKDYTIQGDVVTIKKEYLAAQKTGKISLYFVFSAGRKAVLSVAIKDTTPGVVPDVGNPFEQIQATAFSDSKDVTVKDGIVTLNSAGSYIAFELDFDANVQETVIYASGGSYGTSVSVSWDTLDKNPQTIWNIPHLPTFEEKNAVTNIPSGKHTVYLKTSNPNLQIKWVKFTKQ